jgi:hypothetical protein
MLNKSHLASICTSMIRAIPKRSALVSAIALALLAACGGGSSTSDANAPAFLAQPKASAKGGSSLQAKQLRTFGAKELFDWAQIKFPSLLAGGFSDFPLEYQGTNFSVRSIPGKNAYLGLSASGEVFALAPFTNDALQSYGPLSGFRAQIEADLCASGHPSCASAPGTLGTTSKSSSGFSAQALNGTWIFSSSTNNGCVSSPALSFPGCNIPAFSFRVSEAWSIAGLAGSKTSNGAYYQGENCSGSALGSFARTIDYSFEAADTLISDQTASAAGSQIAVRRGIEGSNEQVTGNFDGFASFFAGCPTLNPEPVDSAEEVCTFFTQLRIERNSNGSLSLFDNQDAKCVPKPQPKPAPFFSTSWITSPESALVRSP